MHNIKYTVCTHLFYNIYIYSYTYPLYIFINREKTKQKGCIPSPNTYIPPLSLTNHTHLYIHKIKMEQELRHLMKRLKVILDETGAKDDNLSRFAGDSFMQLRSRALRKTKEVSDLCDERDEHIKRKLERTQESIKRDQEIRTLVRDVTEITDNLAKVHKQMMKKKKRFSEEEIREKNLYLVEVMQEVKIAIERSNNRPDQNQRLNLNSGLDIDKVTMTGFDALMGSDESMMRRDSLNDNNNTTSNNQGWQGGDIEMSQSVQQKLDLVDQNKQEMDQYLDAISNSVMQLKEYATMFKEEFEVQDALIKDVKKNVEKADEKIENLNEKVDEVLNDKGTCCENQAFNLVLVIIVLGIIGFIIKQIAGS